MFIVFLGSILLWGRNCAVDKALRNGPLTVGHRDAVSLILSEKDRGGGVPGYAGTAKTAMLNCAFLEKRGYTVMDLAPSASAARTLEAEAGSMLGLLNNPFSGRARGGSRGGGPQGHSA